MRQEAALHHGDTLEVMAEFSDRSVDMILCDLPYGTTACKWDVVIPFDKLWEQYKLIIKPRGAIVLTASQPFTSALVMSNVGMFKYCWVWEKSKVTGVLNAKHQPLRNYEDVCVFGDGKVAYYPQGLVAKGTITKQGGCSDNYGARNTEGYVQEFTNHPRQVLRLPSEGSTVHPTQKPVALMEYLIKTYTNEGELVLDNTMGSGSTGVACMNTKRYFIGIERDDKYFAIADERINQAMWGNSL